MDIRELSLTHFSAGEVISSTEGTLENGTVTDKDSLSAEMKTFYDLTLIDEAQANGDFTAVAYYTRLTAQLAPL